MEPIRERTPILTQDTKVNKMRIDYATFYYGDATKTNLRPLYQRDPRWSLFQYMGFIGTIMLHGYIPNIVMYELHPDDEKELITYKFEVIDGQHRLSAIFKFKKSEPVIIHGKEEMIPWYHNETNTYVFYERNAHTAKWADDNVDKRVSYFTEKEKSDFDECTITVEQIPCRLSYEQRCAMFVSLQLGTPVRNSDLFKNLIEIPLISLMTTMKMERIYNDKIVSRLTSAPKQNWVYCVIRLFKIAVALTEEDVMMWVNTDDTKVKHSLEKRVPSIMNTTSDELKAGEAALNRWVSFLDRLTIGLKLTPVQMLAAFVRMQEIETGNEIMIEDRLTNGWAGKSTSQEKKMWYRKASKSEDGEPSIQEKYFNDCIDYLRSDQPFVMKPDVAPRKSLSKKKRDELWVRDHGENEKGVCFVCDKPIEKKKTRSWHAGHIDAHANGGSDTDLENYVIECKDCNLAHGTENPHVYKKRNFSE
jgi:Protein of unknown function DUF262/HNH endonuclease